MVRKFMSMFKTINELEEVMLANYLLQPGVYFIIRKDHKIEGPRIVKKGEVVEDILYEWLKKADYYSQVIEMKKGNHTTIYSSNYLGLLIDEAGLSSFKKKEIRKIEKEIEQFYASRQDRKMQERQEEIRLQLDIRLTSETELKNKCTLAKEMLPDIIEQLEVCELPQNSCLKIFFEAPIETYKKEYEKYVIANEIKENMITINQSTLNIVKSELGNLYFNFEDGESHYRISMLDALLLKRAFEWLVCIVEDDEIVNKIYLPEDFRFDREIQDNKNMEKSKGYITIMKKIENGKTVIDNLEKMYKIPQIN